jgi:hypothetical protein
MRLASSGALALALVLCTAPAAGASAPVGATGSCPKQAEGALPLSANATDKAGQAALAAAPRLYMGLDVQGARIVWSKIANAAGPRGSEVAHQCGKKMQGRTVVVELRFPKELPSASLSEGILFVARFKRGYHVWEVAH